MTDKYTREQKIERLRELLPEYEGLTSFWVWCAERSSSPEDSMSVGGLSKANAEVVWDVHTGVAFTPLYRMLK